jgi:hypothetical protein
VSNKLINPSYREQAIDKKRIILFSFSNAVNNDKFNKFYVEFSKVPDKYHEVIIYYNEIYQHIYANECYDKIKENFVDIVKM